MDVVWWNWRQRLMLHIVPVLHEFFIIKCFQQIFIKFCINFYLLQQIDIVKIILYYV